VEVQMVDGRNVKASEIGATTRWTFTDLKRHQGSKRSLQGDGSAGGSTNPRSHRAGGDQHKSGFDEALAKIKASTMGK
jgi:hypothetical protein